MKNNRKVSICLPCDESVAAGSLSMGLKPVKPIGSLKMGKQPMIASTTSAVTPITRE